MDAGGKVVVRCVVVVCRKCEWECMWDVERVVGGCPLGPPLVWDGPGLLGMVFRRDMREVRSGPLPCSLGALGRYVPATLRSTLQLVFVRLAGRRGEYMQSSASSSPVVTKE